MTAAILPPRAMRPARPSTVILRPAGEPAARRILLMDLHDGPLPEERVGLLAAAFRAGGHEVAVARPQRRAGRVMAGLRRMAGRLTGPAAARPDLLLMSAPAAARSVVMAIAAGMEGRVPVVLDASGEGAGPELWRQVPGTLALIGPAGELELQARLGKVGGIRLGLEGHAGDSLLALCETAQLALSGAADLVPDHADFAWTGPRVVPVRAGGRGIEALLCEMGEQARRLETMRFVFTDAALNADPDRLRQLGARIPAWLQGAEWAARVEADDRRRNGLSRGDLRMAVTGGLRRLAVTLRPGTEDAAAEFLAQAGEAGVIVQADLDVDGEGGPGMTDFLEAQAARIHRLRLTGGACPRLAAIATAINAAPPRRAGLAFAEVLR